MVYEFVSQCRANGETQAKREFRQNIGELINN